MSGHNTLHTHKQTHAHTQAQQLLRGVYTSRERQVSSSSAHHHLLSLNPLLSHGCKGASMNTLQAGAILKVRGGGGIGAISRPQLMVSNEPPVPLVIGFKNRA